MSAQRGDREEDDVAGARGLERELLDLLVACAAGVGGTPSAKSPTHAPHPMHGHAGVGCRTPPRADSAWWRVHLVLLAAARARELSCRCSGAQAASMHCAWQRCMAESSPNGVLMSLPAERADAKSLSSDTGKSRLPEIVQGRGVACRVR